MGVYIPNMSKPKRCIKELDCGLLDEPCLFIDEREACLLQNNSKIGEYEENYKTCPLIEIADDVWENEKHKLIRMTQERRVNKEMAERRTDE